MKFLDENGLLYFWQKIKTKLADLFYPVGRGFIDFTDTDYSNWLGLTWERELVGMFPVGYDANDEDFNEIGKTGGSKTHSHTQASTTGSTTLTASQSGLPAHSHAVKYQSYPIINNKSANSDYNNNERSINMNATNTTSASQLQAISNTAKSASSGHTHTLGSTNSSSSLPQHQVVAYWKRVA